MFAEPVQKLPGRVRTAFQRQDELGDPLVVVAELLLARIRVVDAIDPVGLQRRVVLTRRTDVMMPAACLVQVVVEVGAGGHETVDVTVRQQVRHDQTKAAGAQRPRHAEKDRAVAAEHLLPDPARRPDAASLEGDALHPGEHLVHPKPRFDCERLDRDAEKPRLVRHVAISYVNA